MESPEEIILNILKKIPLFSSLSIEENKSVIENIKLEFFPKNTVIFNEGNNADKMFIVKSGSLKVLRKDKTGEEKPVATIQEGDFFGETALVSNAPRNATVTTMQECELFTLLKNDFDILIKEKPDIAAKISNVIISRSKT